MGKLLTIAYLPIRNTCLDLLCIFFFIIIYRVIYIALSRTHYNALKMAGKGVKKTNVIRAYITGKSILSLTAKEIEKVYYDIHVYGEDQ